MSSLPDVWILTMVRPPEAGMTSTWWLDFGGAGSFDDLAAALKRNAGDVWDNWYPFAVVERMPSACVVPGSTPIEARWFAMHCPDGVYGAGGVTAVECAAPADLPNAGTGHALCTMFGRHAPHAALAAAEGT